MSKFCTKCGSQLNSESRFCSDCGHVVSRSNQNTAQNQTESIGIRTQQAKSEQRFYVNQQSNLTNNQQYHPQQVIINQNSLLQTKMFANPFSFKGRIRRLEMGLSIVINLVTSTLAYSLVSGLDSIITMIVLFLLFYIALMWFSLAQATKRCHDLGKSGWFQLIPLFNPFWLVFQSGKSSTNQYGAPPKSISNLNQYYVNQTPNQGHSTSYSNDKAGIRRQ